MSLLIAAGASLRHALQPVLALKGIEESLYLPEPRGGEAYIACEFLAFGLAVHIVAMVVCRDLPGRARMAVVLIANLVVVGAVVATGYMCLAGAILVCFAWAVTYLLAGWIGHRELIEYALLPDDVLAASMRPGAAPSPAGETLVAAANASWLLLTLGTPTIALCMLAESIWGTLVLAALVVLATVAYRAGLRDRFPFAES
jgi:hypothetical protein